MSIVRQYKFSIPRHYYYNAGVVLFLFLTALLALRSTFHKEEIPLCEMRYSKGALFSLSRRSGEPLTPGELQGRLAGRDWGLNKNARIVADDNVPAGFALEITLKKANAKMSAEEAGEDKSGLGFTWLPRQLETAAAACLSYSIWTPPEFGHGTGGLLPGLAGGRPEDLTGTSEASAARPFATHMQWRADGSLSILAATPDSDRKGTPLDSTGYTRLEPGRWMRIEQEILLNTPGERNGVLRVWVDGKLKVERTDVVYRTSPEQRLLGVSAEIHYTRNGIGWGPSPKDTVLRISPLELRVH